MSRDTNNLTIVGRVVKDAEIAYTSSSICYAKFSIANNGWKEGDVSFFNCILWGKTAENVGKYITKGKQLSLQGEINQTKWEQDGKTRYGFEIKVDKVQLLGGVSQSNKPQEMFQTSNKPENFEDDIPF